MSVAIGLDKGLRYSGNKPLPFPEPMSIQIYVAIWRHKATMSYRKSNHKILRIPILACVQFHNVPVQPDRMENMNKHIETKFQIRSKQS